MEYVKLGRTGLDVSRLCLGTMGFGNAERWVHKWVLEEDDSRPVIKHALDAGINFFDTANVYSIGRSEEIVGKALVDYANRDEIVLATKVHGKMHEGPNGGGLSRKAILAEAEASLRRLGTDYIDLYIIHRFDYATPVEETLEALDTLVRSGRVRALGASSMYAYQLHTMQVTADAHGWTRFSSMQNHYNLLYREDEREMIPVCRQYDMSLTPYSPLASGHLTRPTWDSDSVRSTSDATMRGKYDRGRETDMPIIERVAELAQRHHVAMADVALAWLWAKGVAAPIVGCSRPSRVDDAVRALELTLAEEEVAFLEEPYVPHELVGPLPRPGDVSQR